jgi:hypothetical protein
MANDETNHENNGYLSPSKDPKPPQLPPFPRKLKFHRLQLIGIPLLMVLPVLGLFGLFGESFDTVRSENSELSMQVEFPTRYRYQMVNDMIVTTTNLSDQASITVTVTFERQYIDRFSKVAFTPDVARVTDEQYVVQLEGLGAGETSVIFVELQGDEYWRHTGVVEASLPGGEPVRVEVGTTVFP